MSEPPSRPTAEQLARYAELFSASSALNFFGVRLSFPDNETVRVDLDPVKPEHRGGMGTDAVNGGVLAAIFDLAIGCTPALLDPTRRNATVQLSMSFEKATKGDAVSALAWIDRAGETMIFATAVLRDATGAECARCQGIVRRSKLTWASGESPAVD
jgi:acyl-coenzyme A thioesterase PaaI-like protein